MLMNLAIERRRKSFRHKIRPSIVIRVEIFVHGRPIGAGRIADISLGGMGLLLNRWSNSLTRTCTVRFHLPGEWR